MAGGIGTHFNSMQKVTYDYGKVWETITVSPYIKQSSNAGKTWTGCTGSGTIGLTGGNTWQHICSNNIGSIETDFRHDPNTTQSTIVTSCYTPWTQSFVGAISVDGGATFERLTISASNMRAQNIISWGCYYIPELDRFYYSSTTPATAAAYWATGTLAGSQSGWSNRVGITGSVGFCPGFLYSASMKKLVAYITNQSVTNCIAYSSDGGSSWTVPSVPLNASYGMMGMFYVCDMIGNIPPRFLGYSLASGTNLYFMISSDAINWTRTALITNFGSGYYGDGGVYIKRAHRIVVKSGSGTTITTPIYYSDDGGTSWTKPTLPSQAYPTAAGQKNLHFDEPTGVLMFADGAGNGVFYSLDFGANWTKAAAGNNGVAFASTPGAPTYIM